MAAIPPGGLPPAVVPAPGGGPAAPIVPGAPPAAPPGVGAVAVAGVVGGHFAPLFPARLQEQPRDY